MYKTFKVLTILAFVVGLFLRLSGNDTYFSQSGGTGFVIFVIGTPLFAILTDIFKNKDSGQGTVSNYRPDKWLRNGLIILVLGFLIYLCSSLDDQNLGGIGVAAIGALVGLAGIIAVLASALKR